METNRGERKRKEANVSERKRRETSGSERKRMEASGSETNARRLSDVKLVFRFGVSENSSKPRGAQHVIHAFCASPRPPLRELFFLGRYNLGPGGRIVVRALDFWSNAVSQRAFAFRSSVRIRSVCTQLLYRCNRTKM